MINIFYVTRYFFLKNTLDGEKISIKHKSLFIAFALLIFLFIGCVSASEDGNVSVIEKTNGDSELLSSNINLNEKVELEKDLNENSVVKEDNSQEVIGNGSPSAKVVEDKKAFLKVVSSPTIIKGNYFQVKLSDENGTGITKKKVSIVVDGKTYKRNTDAKGIASLRINLAKNYYDVKYSFKGDGYTSASGSSNILVLTKTQSTFKASSYVAFKGFSNPFTVTLSADGIKLKNKKIRFNINGKNYYRTTNSKGQATLNIGCSIGTYTIKYYFSGEKNIKASSGKSKITVKKMTTKISKANSVKYYHKTTAPFKVKVVDARGNPVVGNVTFSVNKKKYTRNTNSKGIATLNLKLSQGSYKLTYTFAKTSLYEKSSKSLTLNVKTLSKCANNGYWLFGYNMKNVDLDKLAKTSTKHIFLNFAALEKHGKSAVETFIADAKKKGISVHIWMQVFYTGGKWISATNGDGSYKYSFFNSKIKEAKEYANLKGVAGVHLDYLRFPGTAYKHANGAEAINYFTKKLCDAVHKINSKLIVSAAVMPETDSNKYYYGQDIPTLSKYLDVIIPMIYKGNYASGTSWIQSTTDKFVKMSNGAQIWAGIQSYRSDDDVTSLSSSELLKDYKSAANGGATGVVSFRWEISKLIDFDLI